MPVFCNTAVGLVVPDDELPMGSYWFSRFSGVWGLNGTHCLLAPCSEGECKLWHVPDPIFVYLEHMLSSAENRVVC